MSKAKLDRQQFHVMENQKLRFSQEWTEKPLVDLAHITMGQSPSSVFYNLGGEGLPLIQGNADIENRQTIERVWTTQGNKRCDLGDLILTVRAPVGATAVASKRACIGRGVCSLKPFGDSSFLFHALVHAEDRWQTLEQGSTFTAANSEQVGRFRLRIPEDENEQRAIAEALSDVDTLLNALEALIKKERAVKQATMQQLLTGKTRLPGFSGAWETARISDLLAYRRPDPYIVQSTEYTEHGNIPVLTANKAFILGYTDEVSGICNNFPVIVFDDFTTDSKYATFPFKVKSSAIKLLYPKHVRVSLKYVFERMQLIDFPLGNHKRFYISEYQNLELYAPDYDEQHAIAAVLSDIDAEITALEQRRDKTSSIKQGMMQQLLTGQVRLVKPDTSTSSAKGIEQRK